MAGCSCLYSTYRHACRERKASWRFCFRRASISLRLCVSRARASAEELAVRTAVLAPAGAAEAGGWRAAAARARLIGEPRSGTRDRFSVSSSELLLLQLLVSERRTSSNASGGLIATGCAAVLLSGSASEPALLRLTANGL